MQDNNASGISLLPGRISRSIFSLTKSSNARTISNKLSRARVISVSICLSVLLAGMAVVSTMRGNGGVATAFDESIATYESANCTTPKSSWNLGETACAKVMGAPDDRRIAWVAPNGLIAQTSNSFSGSSSDSYSIPTTGDFAQVGTWTVQTIDAMGSGNSSAEFVVRDPNNANVDLAIGKYGPFETTPGANINYRVEIINHGPDDAQVVTLTDVVPAGTTFVSEVQNSGPTFTCVTPPGGGTGTITCTIATLAANEVAVFSIAVNVASGAADGTVITNVATVASTTHELNTGDNSASTSATVNAATTACSLNCPSNITRNNDPNQCSAVVTYATPTTSGNCGTDPVICNPPSGSTFPVGTTNVNCSIQSGGTCSFTVTVQDTRPPVQPSIVCPGNQSVAEDPDSGEATVNYPPPTVTGNCVTTVCNPPSGSRFRVGTTVVNCTATDSANNVVTCSFNVTVVSGDGCTITCPSDVTQTAQSGQCSAAVTYSAPSTSGNCGTVSCTPPSGSTFQVGSTPVTCSSSEASCTFTVTVVAPAAPTITTCATDKTLTADANCEATIPNLVSEVVATGCNVIVSQSPAAGSIVGPGIYPVTITAENSAGEVSCTATVTVLTPAPPTITCPANITTSNDSGQCGAVVSYSAPTGTSSCETTVTYTCSPATGSFFAIGTTNVTCTARDDSGNSSSCSFSVTVNDTQPPVITCPANITRSNDNDQCSAVVNYASPTATDNCPGVTTSCSPATGTEFAVGTTTVTCTATDTANHTATCSFTVTVTDSQPPQITCPADMTVGTVPNSTTAVVNYAPTVSDNCPGVTATCSPASGSTFQLGTATVTCTATDASNNQASCSFTVTVVDTQPPTITCPPNQERSNDPNQCGAVVNYPAPTVTDNQPGATATCNPPSGSFFAVGVTNVTCTATDVGNNHSSCSFTVRVRDTQAPTIVCPANMTVPNTPGQCSATVNPGTAVAADNCPGVTVVGSRSDGLALTAPYPVGTTTITWTARDAAGNETSCTQTIVVNDTQLPTITMRTGPQMELWPPNHQYVTVRVSDFVVSASDNCSGNLTNNVLILKISSDEPDDASGDGDGTTINDIVIAADCKSAQLRAERQSDGNGRIYTITFRVRDAAGNLTTSTAKVGVPKSQGNNNAPVDDGPDHTINSSCP